MSRGLTLLLALAQATDPGIRKCCGSVENVHHVADIVSRQQSRQSRRRGERYLSLAKRHTLSSGYCLKAPSNSEIPSVVRHERNDGDR